jgi:hypothetical protein
MYFFWPRTWSLPGFGGFISPFVESIPLLIWIYSKPRALISVLYLAIILPFTGDISVAMRAKYVSSPLPPEYLAGLEADSDDIRDDL